LKANREVKSSCMGFPPWLGRRTLCGRSGGVARGANRQGIRFAIAPGLMITAIGARRRVAFSGCLHNGILLQAIPDGVRGSSMGSRRNPFSMLGGDEPPEDRSWYDTMQACENGHEITSMAVSHPEYRKRRCTSCGAATITECPKCGTPIQGYHHIPGFAYADGSPPPAC